MSERKESREGDHRSPKGSTDSEPVPGFFNRIPARLWFPAGFVGFFFILGGWNQIRSSFDDPTGRSLLGSGPGMGLVAGSVVFFFCLLMGLRAWWHERTTRGPSDHPESHWRNDLKEHNEDIHFP
ncbi:MAG: hypothetical protein R3F07_07610 [Opitutaceae bacterium]